MWTNMWRVCIATDDYVYTIAVSSNCSGNYFVYQCTRSTTFYLLLTNVPEYSEILDIKPRKASSAAKKCLMTNSDYFNFLILFSIFKLCSSNPNRENYIFVLNIIHDGIL